jgi:uncharacterized protein
MIKFDIIDLEHQPLDLAGSEPSSFLDIEESPVFKFNAPAQYQLNICKVNQGVLVKGTIATTAEGICGRCLEQVTIPIANNDICRFYEEVNGTELDITDDIREELVINIPLNCICSDACQGLCPVCGNNQNLKPCDCHNDSGGNDAWSELDKLKL